MPWLGLRGAVRAGVTNLVDGHSVRTCQEATVDSEGSGARASPSGPGSTLLWTSRAVAVS